MLGCKFGLYSFSAAGIGGKEGVWESQSEKSHPCRRRKIEGFLRLLLFILPALCWKSIFFRCFGRDSLGASSRAGPVGT